MKKTLIHNLILFALCFWASSSAYAVPDGTGNEIFIENVGIGTMTPQGALVVTNGNVGIGTWTTAGGNLIVKGGGNVGIGSAWPGQVLDINGTVRMTGFNLSTGVSNGYVLTSDGGGNGTWAAASGAGWATTGSNLYNTNSGNVGINTTNGSNVGIGTSAPQGAFVVTNGNVGIGTWAPISSLNIIGSIGVVTVSKSSNYTATASDHVILVSTSGGAVTITLPAAASSSGREYQIKKTDSSANAMTIKGNSSENIDGANTLVTTSQYQSYTVVCDGTQWWVI